MPLSVVSTTAANRQTPQRYNDTVATHVHCMNEHWMMCLASIACLAFSHAGSFSSALPPSLPDSKCAVSAVGPERYFEIFIMLIRFYLITLKTFIAIDIVQIFLRSSAYHSLYLSNCQNSWTQKNFSISLCFHKIVRKNALFCCRYAKILFKEATSNYSESKTADYSERNILHPSIHD